MEVSKVKQYAFQSRLDMKYITKRINWTPSLVMVLTRLQKFVGTPGNGFPNQGNKKSGKATE